MFDFIPQADTRHMQFVALQQSTFEQLIMTYTAMGDEERFAMFNIWTGAAIYSLPDSVLQARMMTGLLTEGVVGFKKVIAQVLDECDPDCEGSFIPDEEIEKFLS